jgi:hypothetical protein
MREKVTYFSTCRQGSWPFPPHQFNPHPLRFANVRLVWLTGYAWAAVHAAGLATARQVASAQVGNTKDIDQWPPGDHRLADFNKARHRQISRYSCFARITVERTYCHAELRGSLGAGECNRL